MTLARRAGQRSNPERPPDATPSPAISNAEMDGEARRPDPLGAREALTPNGRRARPRANSSARHK